MTPQQEAEEDRATDIHGLPLTDIKTMTPEEIATYRECHQWLDNPAYQPQDHEQACKELNIQNPDRPRIEGFFPSVHLKFFQPVAVHRLVQIENSLVQGGILGEEMGLGKTIEIIALLLHRSNQRRIARQKNLKLEKALPTLILMPKVLINQWKDEILRFTDRFKILVYYGVAKHNDDARLLYHKGVLTKASPLFNGSHENSDVIILSSYTTWGTRHGPKKQWKWLTQICAEQNNTTTKEADKRLKEGNADYNWPVEQCPFQLSGQFERVILDEGHEIRNLSKENGIAVLYTNARYRHIMTGTPIVNDLSEFGNLMLFLQNKSFHDEPYLRNLGFEPVNSRSAFQKIIDNFDPWSVPDDDARSELRLSKEALDTWVFDKQKGLSMAEIGSRLTGLFRHIMVRRSYASYLNGRRIGEDLPSVQRLVFECHFTPLERQHYESAYSSTSSALFKKNKNQSAVVCSTTTYRKLCLITSWLGFAHLLHYKVQKLKEFRKQNGTARTMIKHMRANQRAQKLPADKRVQVPQSEDDVQEILDIHCTGSPKLRKLLSILAEVVVLRKEKVSIWLNMPAQMEWLCCVSSSLAEERI